MIVSNPHLSLVYELYYKAFERFRVVPEICSLDDNDRFCDILRQTLKEHLVIIPNLAMGVLECQELMPPDDMDRFMNTLLRAVGFLTYQKKTETRTSLTDTFANRGFPAGSSPSNTSPSPIPSTHHGTSQTRTSEPT